eukprot:Em0021g179a
MLFKLKRGHPKCFYQGTVDGYPSWTVALSTCSGIRGSFGDMATKTSLFHIEPLGDNKNRSLDQPHVLFMEAEYENRTRTCGTSHDHNVKPEAIRKELHHLAEKFRRQATGQSSTPLIVELVIINDLAQYQKYGSDLQMTVNRAIDVTNGADSLYKAFGIRIVLVQVITWTSSNLISVVPDSETTLANLQVYAPAGTIQHDVTMLLTGISLNSFVVGLAYVSGMCSSYSVNLVEDFGSLPAVASTTAHELGHLFSMQHDNSMMFSKAQPSSHPLMHLPFSSIPYSQLQLCTANGMHHVSSARLCSPWSSCSVNSITTALSTTSLGSCLTNVLLVLPNVGMVSVRETKHVTVGLPRSAQIHVAMLLHVIWLQEHSAMEEHVAATVVFSPMCPVDQLAQDGTSCGSGTGFCYNGSCPTGDSQCKAFYGSAGGDGDSSCYNYNIRGDLHGNCGPTGFSTYAACIARSFVVTPSDGSITNIWLVQNGTKCGTNQICLSSQCLPLTSLNTRACPVGSNGVVCSGNGVCTNALAKLALLWNSVHKCSLCSPNILSHHTCFFNKLCNTCCSRIIKTSLHFPSNLHQTQLNTWSCLTLCIKTSLHFPSNLHQTQLNTWSCLTLCIKTSLHFPSNLHQTQLNTWFCLTLCIKTTPLPFQSPPDPTQHLVLPHPLHQDQPPLPFQSPPDPTQHLVLPHLLQALLYFLQDID